MKNRLFFAFSVSMISVLGVAASIFSSRASTVHEAKATAANSDQEYIVPGETELDLSASPLKADLIDATTTSYGAGFDIKLSTGDTALQDTEYVFNIIDESGAFVETDEKIKAMDKDTERKEYYQKLQDGEIEPIVIPDCFVHSAGEKPTTWAAIPRTMYRGEGEEGEVPYYYGVINAIASGAFKTNLYIQTVYIPNTIDSIPEDAFVDSNVQRIYCEVEEENKPAGWLDGWNNNIPVVWGYEDIYDESTDRADFENVSIGGTTQVGNEDVNYIVGNYPTDEQIAEDPNKFKYYPAVVEYKLEGSNELHFQALRKKSNSNIYDGVGFLIYGYTNRLNVVVDLASNEKIDWDSIRIHNIFVAKENPDGNDPQYIPDYTLGGQWCAPHKLFNKVYDLGEFVNISFKRVSRFNGYVSVSANVDIVNYGMIFKEIKTGVYKSYESKLNSGKAYIRARFTSLPLAQYRMNCGGVETISQVRTPITQIVLSKNSGNNVNFIVKEDMFNGGFNIKEFKSFAIQNLTISLDIVDNGTIIKRTVAHTKFGCIYFYTPDDTIKTFNANTLLILLAVGYTAGAAILATFLFFLYKKIYKNDEFRRLKPKQFIKKSIIYWLTSMAVVLFIAFVVLRISVFNNAIVVYNPLDVFITFLGIATIIIIGYYVKEITAAVKANKQRKKALKLGLGNDVADDGTK